MNRARLPRASAFALQKGDWTCLVEMARDRWDKDRKRVVGRDTARDTTCRVTPTLFPVKDIGGEARDVAEEWVEAGEAGVIGITRLA